MRNASLNSKCVAKQDEFCVSFSCCSGTTVWSCETRSPSKTLKDRYPDRPIRSLFQDQQGGASNHIALLEPTSRIVQSYRSFRTNKLDRPIRAFNTDLLSVQTNQISSTDLLSVHTNQIYPTDQLSVQTNQIFPTDLLSVQTNQISSTDLLSVQTNQIYPTDLLSVQTNQIFPTDLLPYEPIRYILQTYFRTDQSDLSYGPTSVPANQISSTELHPYKPIRLIGRTYFPYKPIRLLGQTYFPYEPIRLLGASPARISLRYQVTRMVTDRMSDERRKSFS